ncbi:hypothetical protein JTB14_007504 [Gonioctena quinquepunctata]|nr:hypothetical protein JTB14_007504 [Gonioctena quinquepunctata]
MAEDPWYRGMLDRVTEQPLKYPQWRIFGGRLYKYAKPHFPGLGYKVDNWKEVIPRERRNDLIEEAHDPPTSGHMGVLKTYGRVSENFYWPKLRCDVVKYIKRCQVCAAHNGENKGPRGFMVPQPRVTRPWEIISKDLMGPFPKSSSGNQYILVVMDLFSEFALTYPLRTATASALYIARMFSSFMRTYGVKIRYNAYYHPQANPTERYNRTLKRMLRVYVSDNHRKWDVNLSKVACATRTAVHESTNNTPYYINFGRNMILHGSTFDKSELAEDSGEEDHDSSVEGARDIGFRRLFADVQRRLSKAVERNAKAYNLRRRPEPLLPRQRVWRRNFGVSDASKYFTSKLAPKYVGPFQVRKKVSPWTYELEDFNGISKGVWNIKDLKPASASENLPR